MLSFFTSKKAVARNRELGPGGIPLKDYGIPGRTNLVEALSDMAKEDDRASDHLDHNDIWIDLDAQKGIMKFTPRRKPDVQVTVEATDELINELQAGIVEDWFTEEGIQRRAMEALHSSVEKWLERTVEPELAFSSSSDAHSASSNESSGTMANFYRLPKDETLKTTKFTAPIFDDETFLTAHDDANLSSAIFWGNWGKDSG
ncbi:uncharacterized protein BKA55DRAFT_596693 [Fusarium redolens]|uniref:Uncharacterized protein n=1 Tax=Fusarium redolens TaxID=48865 RepID=A0A9P9K4P5_FUSRE|nr:uncharacterized protein BKA55DRAFT_596693 [Fusarium redolens]KAH7240074.1 hypothetical protein BKA55DRAFT_596693 [Fusarium redolens]